jgi:thioredoxin-dependent peroxiredoxin
MAPPRPRARPVGVNDPAPDFELLDQGGDGVRLSRLRGRPVVLFFYPKDSTRGCTAQVCAFRDAFEAFAEAGAVVLGVSSDPVDSHRRFADAHELPFRLLADEGGAVRERYGVPKSLGILPGRVTYVIDGHGMVRHVFSSQTAVGRHVREALETVRELTLARR